VDDPRPEAIWNAEPPPVTDRNPLRRHRVLQIISVVMIASGILLPVIALVGTPDLLSGNQTPDSVPRLIGPLLLLVLGGLLLVTGLVLNAIRAVIVRAALPPERYRGPAIFVLLLLALIVGNLIGLAAGADAMALVSGGQMSQGGTLVLVTALQLGMLIVVGSLVAVPRALAGMRLAPRGRVGLAILAGFGLAIPAWIGATSIAALIALVLEALGVRIEPQLVDQVVDRGDPTALLIGFVVVAPIAEELLFRGVVFNAWERERGTRVAVYGSALLFAVIHGPILFAPVLALGILLAQVYRVTRSLPTTMAIHAGFNAISLALALLVRLGKIDIPI
jgi:membrane protease YdiL (CAAX protease family)